jgi:DNA-binding XRE family transcriptional regulator
MEPPLGEGTSKSQLARRADVSRMTVMRIDENRERYLARQHRE